MFECCVAQLPFERGANDIEMMICSVISSRSLSLLKWSLCTPCAVGVFGFHVLHEWSLHHVCWDCAFLFLLLEVNCWILNDIFRFSLFEGSDFGCPMSLWTRFVPSVYDLTDWNVTIDYCSVVLLLCGYNDYGVYGWLLCKFRHFANDISCSLVFGYLKFWNLCKE